jgi:uncharacterized membrane protein
MKTTFTRSCLIFLAVSGPCLSDHAAMTVQSLNGPVTTTEISSFKTFMQGRTPPTANSYDNNMADGGAGSDCEALGMMYEVSQDTQILDKMIQYADAFLSLRNDFTDHRVMWTGNVEPVWLTKTSTSPQAGYAGCENNEIAGHIANCAKLILQTPAIWNTTVAVGDPQGYGATYYQRALTYVAQMDTVQDNYMTPWFIDPSTKRIKDSTAVDPAFSALGQSTTAWNRQMMFLNGWQRLSECHAILGDDPARVTLYDAIVQASISWFQSEWQNTTGGGQPCYVWQYAPGHSGGNEEMNGHAAFDMWGLSRAFSSGKYSLTVAQLRPFAETLRYIIYQGNNTFAEWVNGDTTSTRNYIFSQWMGISAYDPCVFSIMANADIAQGSQGSNPIYDAFILWVKNNRATGFYATNCDTADFCLEAPWVQTVTAGGNSTYPVSVSALSGFASTVTLGMTGLPAGVSASFTAGNNSTLTLSASGSTAAGVYRATISGTGGGITRIVPVTLIVPATPDFSLSGTPASGGVQAGGSVTYTVNVASLNGFSGTVALSASGLPAGASANFNPASVAAPGSSTLTVTTSSSTPPGGYTITITGVSGSLTHSTTVSLSVADFTISATPASQTVPAGSATNYTVNIGNVNGFSGTITFNVTGLPAGTTAAFNPTSVSSLGSSTMTITTSASTPPGTNVLTISGTSGSVSHSTTVTLVVTAAGPVNLALNKAASASTVWSATYDASKAVDGNTATRWSAASAQTSNQWLLVDLGSATTYDSVVIKEISFARVTAFKIQSSTDGTTFTDRASGTTIGAAKTVSFNAVSARYVRLFVISASDVPTINEFEVYSSGAAPTFTITATAGANGAVTPSGSVVVNQGADQSFTITPNSGYQVANVLVDGASAGAVTTYTFSNVQADHTINATFSLTPVPDFSVSATPSSQTVTAGGNTTYTATVSATNGFSGSVTLTASGLPVGANATFSPSTIAASGSSTLTVSTTASTSAGTYALTVAGTSGTLSHSANVTLVVNPASGLPPGWTDVDVGTPSIAGSATYSAGVFTAKGSGADIWGTADQFNYVYQAVSGDQTIVARVTSQSGANAWAKSGVMFRESTAAGASYIGLYVTPGNGVSMQYRNGTGTNAVDLARQTGLTAPYWVKLARSGNTFTGSSSADGSTWTQVGTISVTMAAAATAGLPICSHDNTTLNTATVDNVSITTPAPDFSVAASPSSQTVTAGNTTNYTATVSALNGFTGNVALTLSGLPTGATGNFNPASIAASGSSTLTVATATNTPAGTYTLTVTGTSGSLVHTAAVTLVVNSGASDSNIAPGGTAYGWSGMTSGTANTGKTARAGLNDNNLTADVDIQPAGDAVGAWEAAGVTWTSAKTISSANFINGTITAGGDGFLTANCKLQFSTDGTTWADSGWTISPAYPNSSAAGGQTYTFTGAAVSGKLGARVVGQVRTTDTSYHWIVKEVRFIGH